MNDYEHEALLFAEKYGIIEYKVKNNIMTFIDCGYDCELNLDTMKETRTKR